MRGDFTRDTFDPARGFTRVLMQQGRVQLDADWNEQASIFHHFLRSLARDLIGPHGGPADDWGFEIVPTGEDIHIGAGTYYVDGIRCENRAASFAVPFSAQPYYGGEPLPPLDPGSKLLVYLDVWERHVTYVEQPSIREVALLGPDTASRAQLVWQVRVLREADLREAGLGEAGLTAENAEAALRTMFERRDEKEPKLTAFTKKPEATVDPCKESPDARYRGLENQLYRVEIHDGGAAAAQPPPRIASTRDAVSDSLPAERGATFKWSRENGSVVFPVEAECERAGGPITATLQHLGRDPRFGLKEGDWVEWVTEAGTLSGQPGPLLRVAHLDVTARKVTLEPPQGAQALSCEPTPQKALLRRWDQKGNSKEKGGPLRGGAIPVVEGQDILLENGIAIRFERGATYRTGDYWLIPARTATGDVEWPDDPKDSSKPLPSPPRGIEHHHAPLALLAVNVAEGEGRLAIVAHLRRKFERLAK